jgi:hypothetical protein
MDLKNLGEICQVNLWNWFKRNLSYCFTNQHGGKWKIYLKKIDFFLFVIFVVEIFFCNICRVVDRNKLV